MKKDNWAIGIDLGGTKIKAAHVSKDGTVRDQVREKTDVSGGPKAVKKQIIGMAHGLMKKTTREPVSLGIGIAGQVDGKTGAVSFAPNLNWRDVPIDSALEKDLDIPVTVLNDVRAATWGEWLHGAGKGIDNLVCIFIGTGIGGGIISGGKMLSGASNTAGEIGHMTISLNGPLCHCGNRGCLESMAGSWAILRDAEEIARKNRNAASTILDLAGGKVEDLQARHVIQAYMKHDSLADEIIQNVIEAIAGGLTGLTNALNPTCIVMGGGVTEHLPDLPSEVEKKIRKKALDAAVKSFSVVSADLHDDSGVVGAAAYTFRKEKGEL